MIHTYDVEQLRESSDVELFTERLSSVDGVRTVAVSPEKHTVIIDMDHHIAQNTFNSVLSGSGPWRLVNERMVKPEGPQKGLFMTYLPLLLMVGSIIAAALYGQYRAGMWQMWDWPLMMRHLMAGFFLLFGGLKLLTLRAFMNLFEAYDLLGSRSQVYAGFYPFLEVGLGVAHLVAWQPYATNVATLIVMLFGALGVALTLRHSTGLRCACLGSWVTIPLSWVTVAEYLAMAVMAAWMLSRLT